MAKKQKKAKKKKKSSKSKSNGLVGRDKSGQFVKGHKLSIGNRSHASEPAKQLKEALLAAISVKDMQDIIAMLIKKSKEGDIPAIKELFDRALGRPLQTHEVDVEITTYTPEQCDSIRKMLAGRCVNADS